MSSTNYFDTFIAVAADCPAAAGTEPPSRATPSVALMTFRLISERPYAHTSDDVIFEVYAERAGIPPGEREVARQAFFAKPQPCLRASDLGKRYGWGIHHDSAGRVALYGVESPEYAEFTSGGRRSAAGAPVALTQAMRSRR